MGVRRWPTNSMAITENTIDITLATREDLSIRLAPGDRVRGHRVTGPVLFVTLISIECESCGWPDDRYFQLSRRKGTQLKGWFDAHPKWQIEETTELFEKGYWATFIG